MAMDRYKFYIFCLYMSDTMIYENITFSQNIKILKILNKNESGIGTRIEKNLEQNIHIFDMRTLRV